MSSAAERACKSIPSNKSKFSPAMASTELKRARFASQKVYSEIDPFSTRLTTNTEKSDCGNFCWNKWSRARSRLIVAQGQCIAAIGQKKSECRGNAPNFESSRRKLSLQFGHCGIGSGQRRVARRTSHKIDNNL